MSNQNGWPFEVSQRQDIWVPLGFASDKSGDLRKIWRSTKRGQQGKDHAAFHDSSNCVHTLAIFSTQFLYVQWKWIKTKSFQTHCQMSNCQPQHPSNLLRLAAAPARVGSGKRTRVKRQMACFFWLKAPWNSWNMESPFPENETELRTTYLESPNISWYFMIVIGCSRSSKLAKFQPSSISLIRFGRPEGLLGGWWGPNSASRFLIWTKADLDSLFMSVYVLFC